MLAERALLYRAIGHLTGASWIVDGGKEPIFGALMARADVGTIATIHLVRDPRGVAYSWQKLVPSDSEPGNMPRKAPAKTAVDWVLQNLLVQLGLQRLGTGYVRIRYEDLTSRPEHVLGQISLATGLTIATAATAQHGIVPPAASEHHLVAGNPGVRQAVTNGLQVRTDEAWRTKLPLREQRVVTALCGALMTAYGYSLRTARSRL
jgi:hypothetical protein